MALFLLSLSHTLRTTEKDVYTLCPYIHQVSNSVSSQDQLRAIKIPDVLPGDLPSHSGFSYTAGDFVEVYTAQKGDSRGGSLFLRLIFKILGMLCVLVSSSILEIIS